MAVIRMQHCPELHKLNVQLKSFGCIVAIVSPYQWRIKLASKNVVDRIMKMMTKRYERCSLIQCCTIEKKIKH